MEQIVALNDDDVRRLLRTLNADVQAALALNRATLEALAMLSPALGAAAETALEREADLARQASAPQRVAEVLDDVRTRIAAIPEELEAAQALEHALVAAAARLPDLADMETAASA